MSKLTAYQDNAGVIVNPKGEMKGSAITGPVAKECVRRALLSTTSYIIPDPIAAFRRIFGRVSRRTLVPSYKRCYPYFRP